MDSEYVQKVRDSLERVQAFDPESLTRRDELGALNFLSAVQPAREIISLFQRINPLSLSLFPRPQLEQIQSLSDASFSIFKSMVDFDPEKSGNASGERAALLEQIKSQPESISSGLWHHIAFAVATTLDPTAVQQQMRAAMQSFADEKSSAINEIEQLKAQADEVLTRVRDAAAEQGVSQQAQHFRTVAGEHGDESDTWLKYSLISGAVTLGFAAISSISYKIPWLKPVNGIEVAQLVTSKVLIFAVLSYASFVCVRNFLSHKHNKVVNDHRQNSLLTYTAFVDAAPSAASREIVLAHAAASVFTPQETGYVKQEESPGGRSIMEMITKASVSEARP